MPKDLLTQKNKIIAGVVVLVLVIAGYFWYSSTAPGAQKADAKVNPSLFNTQVKNFYAVQKTIDLSDSFMKGKNEAFFNELHNYTQDIPLKEPTGRTNPFVPYVAP